MFVIYVLAAQAKSALVVSIPKDRVCALLLLASLHYIACHLCCVLDFV